jgi:hypothetical protein
MARAHPPTGSQPPSVELTVRQGPQLGQRFSLTKPTIIIGREAGNDVVVNHPEVSRLHASLTWDGRQHIIQDLGSANGTLENSDTPITIAAVRRSIGIYETLMVMGIDSWNSTQPRATRAAISSKGRRFGQWQVHIPQQALNRLRLS